MRVMIFSVLVVLCCGCGHGVAYNSANADSSNVEACTDTAALHKIQKALTIPDVVDMTAEEFAAYNVDTPLQGLQWINLDTNFNEHCLLGVTVTGEWSAAYIQGFTRYRSFDLRTGNRLAIKDLLKEDSLPVLAKLLFIQIKETAKAQREDIAANKEQAAYLEEYDAQAQVFPKDITAENLEVFHLSKNGIIFVYEFGSCILEHGATECRTSTHHGGATAVYKTGWTAGLLA